MIVRLHHPAFFSGTGHIRWNNIVLAYRYVDQGHEKCRHNGGKRYQKGTVKKWKRMEMSPGIHCQ
jgi:predicted nucleotidyltransferase